VGLFRRVIIRCVSNTYTESAYKKTFSSFSKSCLNRSRIQVLTSHWESDHALNKRRHISRETRPVRQNYERYLASRVKSNLGGNFFDSPQDTWATLTRRKEFLQVQQHQQVMEQKFLESSMGNEPRPRLERPYRSRSKSRLRSSHYEVEHLSG